MKSIFLTVFAIGLATGCGKSGSKSAPDRDVRIPGMKIALPRDSQNDNDVCAQRWGMSKNLYPYAEVMYTETVVVKGKDPKTDVSGTRTTEKSDDHYKLTFVNNGVSVDRTFDKDTYIKQCMDGMPEEKRLEEEREKKPKTPHNDEKQQVLRTETIQVPAGSFEVKVLAYPSHPEDLTYQSTKFVQHLTYNGYTIDWPLEVKKVDVSDDATTRTRELSKFTP